MSAREFVKSIVSTLAPALMNERYIRVYTPKEPEIALLALMCEKDMLAVDVGAHLGLYVHHLLALTKNVIAFEPLPNMQESLRRTYGDRIRLESVALSDSAGAVELRFPDGDYSLATLEPTNDLRVAKSSRILAREIERRSLDSYALERVGFIKIDVEGHEEAVLRGSLDTLRRNKPFLLVEIEERHNPGAVRRVPETLAQLGYAGFFLADGVLRDAEAFRCERDQSPSNMSAAGKAGRYLNNFIFAPRERADAFISAAARLLASKAAA